MSGKAQAKAAESREPGQPAVVPGAGAGGGGAGAGSRSPEARECPLSVCEGGVRRSVALALSVGTACC